MTEKTKSYRFMEVDGKSTKVLTAVLTLQKKNQIENVKVLQCGILVTRWNMSELKSLLAVGSRLLVCFESNSTKLVGYVLFSPIEVFIAMLQAADKVHLRGAKPDAMTIASGTYLYQIAVSPHYHHRGIATGLLEEVFKVSKKNFFVADLMKIPHQNKASLRLFQKFGFKKSGIVCYQRYRNYGRCAWQIMSLKKNS